jgi:hypothetical protein
VPLHEGLTPKAYVGLDSDFYTHETDFTYLSIYLDARAVLLSSIIIRILVISQIHRFYFQSHDLM